MNKIIVSLLTISTIFTSSVFASSGGVGLGATRLVYMGAVTQSTLSVRNTNQASPFLIQSWIEDEKGNRTSDFVITPPLYLLKPASESVIKVMNSGKKLPQDRETLYWLTVKAIPQMDKNSSENSLQFASANRIKVFYRPAGLEGNVNDAWKKIRGEFRQGKITLSNPTPYYITTINISVDGKPAKSVMIPPKGTAVLPDSFPDASQLRYQTINDFGAWTPPATYSFAK